MNLRQEIHDIIEETGHFILLQRTSRRIRCECWNEKYQESDSNCPKCLGKGWVSRIERHKIRRQTATNIITLPNKKKQTEFGQIIQDSRTFFFKYDVRPQKGDMIMEVGWKGRVPTHLIQAFEITHADDMREQSGRTEYYTVTAKEKNVSTDIRGITVRKIGKIRNYEVLR